MVACEWESNIQSVITRSLCGELSLYTDIVGACQLIEVKNQKKSLSCTHNLFA